MTRKLLAILALLSGLAALTGPASVSYAQNSSPCNASVSASAQSETIAQRVRAERAPEKAATRTRRTAPDPRSPTPASLRLPVLMGVERAIE